MSADDVAQTIVASVAAALLEAGTAGGQVELVVSNQHLRNGNLEEICQCGGCLTTAVHEGGRNQQADRFAFKGEGGGEAEIFLVFGKEDALASGQGVYIPDAGIVAGVFVFAARIAQAHDQSNRFRHGASYSSPEASSPAASSASSSADARTFGW